MLGTLNIVWFAVTADRTLVSFYDHLAVPIMVFWLVRAIGYDRTDIGWLIAVGAWTVIVQGAIGIFSWVAPELLPRGLARPSGGTDGR